MIRLAILRPGGDEPFPPLRCALREPNGLLATGGDLGPDRLVEAYRHGIFPWFSDGDPILWWSPDPRLVFDVTRMHVPRRLARWLRHCDWTVTADRAFADVMAACAAPRECQPGTWITAGISAAYRRLHELGHAHSIEIWAGGDLVGGLYGVALGRMFFGESMFSRASNGSKLALLALAHALRDWNWPLIDAQVSSPHLFTLGGFELPREEFARRITRLTAEPGLEGPWTTHFPPISPPMLAD